MSVVRFPRPPALPAASDRFVVVEASAGTGKTFFLEHRVADLILGAGAELGDILLVTFTEKAVAELRMRIRDPLDRMARASESSAAETAWELDDAARARLRAAITAFDHAPIFTIHGFCHRVLVEDAFAARRLFEQTQVADEVAFDAAFTALLRERFALADPDRALLAAWLERESTVDQLRELLLRCARSGARAHGRLEPARVLGAIDALRGELGDEAGRARVAAALGGNGNERRWFPDWLAKIGEAIARCGGSGDLPGAIVACDALREPAMKLLARAARASHPAIAALREAVVLPPLDLAVAAELLPHVLARVAADKSEQGLYDYDDMLVLVRDALHGPRGAELAARLRTRTPWVMIDELQDTDPIQWDIFRTVWLHDGARGVTIVGDPKQAIYGFRGADVKTYLDARDELRRLGATEVALDVNRRSTDALVRAVNYLLLDATPLQPLLDKAISYDHPVEACGELAHDGARPPVTVFQLRGTSREANREALALAIGAEIERLRDAPPSWRRRGATPAFAFGQIMVLSRNNKESAQIAAALRARGLPCALVEGDRLFQTREAADLAAVLAAIAAPRDRSARMRALRTRFFDVPWSQLMHVVDAPDHHPLVARLYDWAALAARRAYEPLFRQLVEDSRFAERALVLGSGERAIVNTWHVLELLLEHVARSRCDLHELVGQLRRWIADLGDHVDDRDVQRLETDSDAIRVLTIHKAKGLEAPYVFVFGAASAPPGRKVEALRGDDGAGRALVFGKDDPLRKRYDAEVDAENQRLAYVALTRAQLRLYLPYYGDDVVASMSTYQPVQRCLEPIVRRGHPLFEIEPIDVGAPAPPPAPPDALAGLDVTAPPPVAELAPLPGARAGLAVLSYTRLARELDAARLEPGELPSAIDPAEFDAEDAAPDDAARVGPGELPPGMDSGLLLHDLLEHAELDGVRRAGDAATWARAPEVQALLADRARAWGISPGYLPHAAQLVYRALTAPIALVTGETLPPLVAAPALAREVEFAYPIDALGREPRGLVKGFIDVLVAWDDELWVLDYKSDVLAPPDLAAAATARAHEHYAIQTRLYALAADRARGPRRLGGLVYAFVRYGIAVAVRTPDDRLAQWAAWLGGLAMEERR
ncbi:MAG TPA: UvrD-helicase domain-containing protein [Kofleriaceae bacterium]|nr:UvrD-helicase domain-containing protein [Kofleriaceae bacterium]